MHSFTPWTALAGGLLIGAAAVLLLLFNGRVAGVSNIAGRMATASGDRAWRLAFVAGLVLGAAGWVAFGGSVAPARGGFPAWALVAAGLLVGYGTALSNGCTSGHGVCGIARLSQRSFAATATFLVVAIATTFVARHLLSIA